MNQKQKRFYIKYGLLAVAVLIVLAVVGLLIFNHGKAQNQSKQSAPPSVQLSLSELTAQLNQKIKAEFPNLKLNPTYDQALKVGYQFSGDDFQMLLPQSANSFMYSYTKSSDETAVFGALSKTLPVINNYLSQQGFSSPVDATPTGSLLSSIYFYKRADAICQAAVYTLLDINCAPASTLQSSANAAAPFVHIYMNKVAGLGKDAVTAPLFKPSRTAGYKLAALNFYNNAGETNVNFYKYGNGGWQMVNPKWYDNPYRNDIVPDCGFFDSSPSMAAAFKGQACYDLNGFYSTVR